MSFAAHLGQCFRWCRTADQPSEPLPGPARRRYGLNPARIGDGSAGERPPGPPFGSQFTILWAYRRMAPNSVLWEIVKSPSRQPHANRSLRNIAARRWPAGLWRLAMAWEAEPTEKECLRPLSLTIGQRPEISPGPWNWGGWRNLGHLAIQGLVFWGTYRPGGATLRHPWEKQPYEWIGGQRKPGADRPGIGRLGEPARSLLADCAPLLRGFVLAFLPATTFDG